jgi:uncharacterized membrane protein
MNTDQDTKNKKTILNLYAILGVSILLSILPYSAAALISLIFMIVVLIWGYSVRKRTELDSLAGNHAVYIVRTIWIASFFALATTALACLYMVPQLNHAPFEACTNALTTKSLEWLESADMNEVYELMRPCVDGFIAVNKALLITAVLIAGGPIIIYMTVRLFKGVSGILKARNIPNAKSWF